MLMKVMRTEGAQEGECVASNSGPAPYMIHLTMHIVISQPNMNTRKITYSRSRGWFL